MGRREYRRMRISFNELQAIRSGLLASLGLQNFIAHPACESHDDGL
jgi:hypothetical protein